MPRTCKAVGRASLRAALAPLPKKRNKFNARKQVVDCITFDSGKEARRYLYLKMCLRCGTIRNLRCHPKYELMVNGILVGTFKPDFSYIETVGEIDVVEDVKSKPTKTEAYRLRAKVFQACYPGITFREFLM